MIDTAFVLAGGLGTRLRAVVHEVPKPMAVVAGRPFLEHLFDYLVFQGVTRIVLCLGYLSHVVENHFGDSYDGCSVLYSRETQPMGTGGALSQALLRFTTHKPFVVVNGDTYFPVNLSVLLDALRQESWAIAAFLAGNRRRYGGLATGPHGQLIDFSIKPGKLSQVSGVRFRANSGVWVGNPAKISIPLLAQEAQYSLEEYLSKALKRDSATAVVHQFESTFIDIGLPADLARAQTMSEFQKW